MLSITKKFRFEAAHAILNYDGLCKNIHGHSYILQVSVAGEINPQTQMIIDFKLLKKIVEEEFVKQVDHSLMLNKLHPACSSFDFYEGKKFLMAGEPTAENIIVLASELIKAKLPVGTDLKRLRLYETESSYAEWESDR